MVLTAFKIKPAFILMFCLVLFLFLKYTLQYMPGIFASDLLEQLGGQAHTLGFLAAAYLYAYLLLQVPAGIMLDRYKLSTVVFVAVLACFAGIVLFTFTTDLTLRIIARILMGSGAAFATVAYMHTAALYFDPKWFARFSGFFGTACMGGAGSIILIFGWLYATLGMTLTSYIMIVCAGVVLLLSLTFRFIKPDPAIENKIVHSNRNRPSILSSIKHIMWNKNNMLLLLYNGLAFAPISVFGGLWGINFLRSTHGLTMDQASMAISAMFYAFAAGGPILATLFTGKRAQCNLMGYGILVSMCFFIALVYLPVGWFGFIGIMVLMCGLGFFAGSFLVSYAVAVSCNPITLVATVIAVVNMGDPIFTGIAEPLMGYMMDAMSVTAHFSVEAYRVGFALLVGYFIMAYVSAMLLSFKKDASKHEN